MFAIFYKGSFIAAFHNATIAANVAISRFTSGQILRNEVEIYATR
jgi:hypothetical protein